MSTKPGTRIIEDDDTFDLVEPAPKPKPKK